MDIATGSDSPDGDLAAQMKDLAAAVREHAALVVLLKVSIDRLTTAIIEHPHG